MTAKPEVILSLVRDISFWEEKVLEAINQVAPIIKAAGTNSPLTPKLTDRVMARGERAPKTPASNAFNRYFRLPRISENSIAPRALKRVISIFIKR